MVVIKSGDISTVVVRILTLVVFTNSKWPRGSHELERAGRKGLLPSTQLKSPPSSSSKFPTLLPF